MAVTSPFSKLIDAVEKFVVKHRGQWNHSEWEQMTREASQLGYPCEEDECKRNLGNILESCKFFYNHGGTAAGEGGATMGEGAAPARKKPAARKKSAS